MGERYKITGMPNVYAYNNYREYLKDYFDETQKKNERFSYRAFNRAVGFTSPNFLRMIVLGKRNLSPKAIKKLSVHFQFNKKQSSFFENLVLFNQSDTYDEKVLYYERIAFFKSYQEIKTLDFKSYQFFSKWYYPTIREMTLQDNFKENPHWIANHLCKTITEEEAKEALELLKDLKLLQYDKNNKLKPVDQNITTDDEVTHISLLHFHKEMIALANQSLENTPPHFRDISSITVGLNESGFKKTKKKLQELRQELNLELSKTKKVEAVYQVNFQLFNLTKIPLGWQKKE